MEPPLDLMPFCESALSHLQDYFTLLRPLSTPLPTCLFEAANLPTVNFVHASPHVHTLPHCCHTFLLFSLVVLPRAETWAATQHQQSLQQLHQCTLQSHVRPPTKPHPRLPNCVLCRWYSTGQSNEAPHPALFRPRSKSPGLRYRQHGRKPLVSMGG